MLLISLVVTSVLHGRALLPLSLFMMRNYAQLLERHLAALYIMCSPVMYEELPVNENKVAQW